MIRLTTIIFMDLLLKARKIKASIGKDNGRKKNTHPQNITKIAPSVDTIRVPKIFDPTNKKTC